MNKSIVAMLGGVGVAATVALLGAPDRCGGPDASSRLLRG